MSIHNMCFEWITNKHYAALSLYHSSEIWFDYYRNRKGMMKKHHPHISLQSYGPSVGKLATFSINFIFICTISDVY